MAHAYNPSYLEGRDWKDWVQEQHKQKVCETKSQPIKSGHAGMWLSS
jgi:hypothetical protein